MKFLDLVIGLDCFYKWNKLNNSDWVTIPFDTGVSPTLYAGSPEVE